AYELTRQQTLVADDRGGLLRESLVLTLGFLDSLLDLNLGVRVLFDLGIEEGHQVFPGLDERISHRLIPPPSDVPLAAARARDPRAPGCACLHDAAPGPDRPGPTDAPYTI